MKPTKMTVATFKAKVRFKANTYPVVPYTSLKRYLA